MFVYSAGTDSASCTILYQGQAQKRRKRRTNGNITLQWLGSIDRISIYLASKAAQAALLCPSLEIARQTLFQHDIELGIKTIQRIIRSIGEQAIERSVMERRFI